MSPETPARCADMRFRRPAENAGPHQLNVESAYLELGGTADPRRYGWRQDWALKDGTAQETVTEKGQST